MDRAPLSSDKARTSFANASAAIGFAVAVPVAVEAAILEGNLARDVSLMLFPAFLVLSGALGFFLVRQTIARSTLRSLLAIPGVTILAATSSGVAAIAFLFRVHRWEVELEPSAIAGIVVSTVVMAGVITGVVLAALIALLKHIARRLKGTLDDTTRAAHDAWIVAFVVFAASAMIVPWLGVWPSDPIPFIALVMTVLGALASATNAVLTQLEMKARDEWLRGVAEKREPRYRIAARTELPPNVELPCVDAHPEECDGILIEEEDRGADVVYRRLPRAVALVRSRARA